MGVWTHRLYFPLQRQRRTPIRTKQWMKRPQYAHSHSHRSPTCRFSSTTFGADLNYDTHIDFSLGGMHTPLRTHHSCTIWFFFLISAFHVRHSAGEG
ncbi:hypothetical protein BDZ85DRAFT_265714 [Elsinoe ampelina]|uniref:Uncharacterized protein n=1 Tax=Elsinoe ampelina TaxID=302913 RepID=A0A6A6G7J4_9PEZI|nr:hypothetical protein BDZ85DRAFT_265714 [Elsinoe ampelina]